MKSHSDIVKLARAFVEVRSRVNVCKGTGKQPGLRWRHPEYVAAREALAEATKALCDAVKERDETPVGLPADAVSGVWLVAEAPSLDVLRDVHWKIPAIKQLRCDTNLVLKEAKDAIERVIEWRTPCWIGSRPFVSVPESGVGVVALDKGVEIVLRYIEVDHG